MSTVLRWVDILDPLSWSMRSPPAAEPRLHQRAVGSRQVRDAWMVEVARQRGGRPVTFDAPLQADEGVAARVNLIP